MGAAMRWVTSEPVAVLIITDTNPATVETAVITTCLTRFDVAVTAIYFISSTLNGLVASLELNF